MSLSLVEKIKAECIVGDDGFYVYWPNKTGAYSPHVLRLIADILDDLNFEWAKQVETLS